MDKIWWIVIIIFASAFLYWIYRDGKFDDLMIKKIKTYGASEFLTVLYAILIIFSIAMSFIKLLC